MGDRSHPQLQVLDDLRLTYNRWEADVCKAEDLHLNYPTRFDCYVEKMQRKQKIHMGDRSHPQLQALDNLTASGTLTYNGWQADVLKAEDYHVRYPSLFDEFVEGKMRRKQALHVGDISHPQLQMLDNLKREGLSYVGWESDVSRAIDEDWVCEFDRRVERMRTKQKIYLGDRSHPQLQALDNLTASGTITYDGWRADVFRAEELHLNHPSLVDDCVEGMRLKQAVHVGDRSHPHLQALDNLKRAGLTYIGWEADLRQAEVEKYAFNFAGHVEEMRRKQAVYVGDRSHPQLQALDSMKREGLTYVGWQGDVLKAESHHVNNNAILFNKCLRTGNAEQANELLLTAECT